MADRNGPPGGSKFQGMSLLRAEEKAKQPKQAVSSAHQDYLKKYATAGSAGPSSDSQPVGKKRKKKVLPVKSAVSIIDQDLTGFAAVRRQDREDELDDDDDDAEAGEDRPTIANVEEGAMLAKQVEKAKAFYSQAQDGSGWVQSGNGASGSGRRPPAGAGDASPPRRRQRHDSPSASPPRRGQRRSSTPPGASPPRRPTRHDTPEDASPPRRPQPPRAQAAPPASQIPSSHSSHMPPPPPRSARAAAADSSPPRRGATAAAASGRAALPADGLSPPRRGQRHDSPPDESPPRRPAGGGGAGGGGGALPPSQGARAGGAARDSSPPRRGQRHDSPDASPPRRSAAATSPPRRGQRHDSPDTSPPRRPAGGGGGGAGAAAAAPPGQRMNDGTVTGLVSAEQLMAGAEKQRKEAELRRAAAGGRGAATVYRDRATGKAVTADEYQESVRLAKGHKKVKTAEEEKAEQHLEWRGGLAQKRAAEQRAAEAKSEAAKPFARGEDDADRDAVFRDRMRFGDPMAHLVKSKAPPSDGPGALTDRYDAEALKESGFIIPQEIPAYSWLKRGVGAPANRYNIKPGRHWDGVLRSTGFEGDMFKQQNEARANEYEARLWSQADM